MLQHHHPAGARARDRRRSRTGGDRHSRASAGSAATAVDACAPPARACTRSNPRVRSGDTRANAPRYHATRHAHARCRRQWPAIRSSLPGGSRHPRRGHPGRAAAGDRHGRHRRARHHTRTDAHASPFHAQAFAAKRNLRAGWGWLSSTSTLTKRPNGLVVPCRVTLCSGRWWWVGLVTFCGNRNGAKVERATISSQ